MSPLPEADPSKLEKLNQNLRKIEELNTRFLTALANRDSSSSAGLHGPGREFYAKTASAFLSDSMANPSKILEQQISYWGNSLKMWTELQGQFGFGASDEASEGRREDKRFRSELWDATPYFKFLKQQYLLNSEAMTRIIGEMEGLDDKEKTRLEFFSRQLIELMNPANFLGTNPEALKRAVDTDGDSLVQGLENLVRDIERNGGELLVTLASQDAFRLGENLATTEGSVVYRNELIELIQYAPLTDRVRRLPLLIIPPWINKYYILDLSSENSFIRWTVEQGYTVFVVSWINPGTEHRDMGIDDYASKGCITAIKEVLKITGEEQLNAVGYCIGGTLLSLVLAYMRKTGSRSVRAATLLTTLTDFSNIGELSVFLEEDFVFDIEKEVQKKGMLPAKYMARTFSFMRAADLVYGPAVRSYMMGEPPPAFDLLYWNGDSTNLPARMAIEYLRDLCQENKFVTGEFTLLDTPVSIQDVRHPVMAIGCEADHIAVWEGSFKGIGQMRSRNKQFILSQSGHIAGIVNPPWKKKYGHYTNKGLWSNPDQWLESAEFVDHSWWSTWESWLASRSLGMVPARVPGANGTSVLAAAPGTYVKLSHSGQA